MVLLNAEHISLSWGEKTLFDDVSFAVEEHDKVGFIGINGTGKSTFLRILAGLQEGDSGTVTLARGTRIGYLPQAPDFSEPVTVLQQVFRGASTSTSHPSPSPHSHRSPRFHSWASRTLTRMCVCCPADRKSGLPLRQR